MAALYALIPARGGSKGLTDKNIRDLCGQPVLSYSVAAARDSGLFTDIVVSSDDARILAAAREAGATAHLRPPQLALDSTPTDPVIAEFIDRRALAPHDLIVLLQPTSPLRRAEHIRGAWQAFRRHDCQMVVSVQPLAAKYLKAYVGAGPFLEPVWEADGAYRRRQDLPPVYLPNGAIYLFTVAAFQQAGGLPRQDIVPYVMSAEDSLDIDSEQDLQQCAMQLQGHGEGGVYA